MPEGIFRPFWPVLSGLVDVSPEPQRRIDVAQFRKSFLEDSEILERRLGKSVSGFPSLCILRIFTGRGELSRPVRVLRENCGVSKGQPLRFGNRQCPLDYAAEPERPMEREYLMLVAAFPPRAS